MRMFAGKRRPGSRKAKTLILAAFALAAADCIATQASAQPVLNTLPPNCTGTVTGRVSNLGTLGGSAGAVSSVISGVIGNINTAFLTQQGSAFVSAPANPAPGQEGGGVWARAIGGEVSINSTTVNNGVTTGSGAGATLSDSCKNDLHQIYSGLQVGTDISKLNWNGWNVHFGTTAGYLGSTATDNSSGNGGLTTGIEVPFFGLYLVATHDRFFADIMVRQEFYNLDVNAPNLNINNQPIGAHGISVSTSAGYNFALANNWFIEPSAGFVWSNTKVDSFNSAVPNGLGETIGGTTTTNNVLSEIGRLSVRVGTTVATPNVVYQPFASASVFHEFAGSVVSNFAFCPTCAVFLGSPQQYSQQAVTSRVGTYGQFSVGLAAQIVNTGWLGFVRADYRIGDNIEGYAGNVGLRYQFSPDAAPVMYTKAVKAPVAVGGTTNWAGFYLGGYAGGAYGRTDIHFANDPANAGNKPYVFGPMGGFQAGYNYQVNNWVFGVEGDIGGARLRGGRPCGTDDGSGNVNGFNPFYQECNDRMNWIATAAARLGYASGRTLYYVKAGGAWTNGTVTVNCIDAQFVVCLNPAGNQYPTSFPSGQEYTGANYNRVGWLLGYGTEFDLGNHWSAKAEYDYISFGKQTQLATDGQTLLYSHASISQAKIGLNYRFGGDDGIVAAAPMYAKAPVRAPLVDPIYDWSGFYVGANVGGGVSNKNWLFFDDPGFISEGTHRAGGPVAGGQVGWRGQSGRMVYGVEAQGNWANVRGSNDSDLFSNTNATRINSLGVFTGQIGYTAYNTLIYVKGGAVVVNDRFSVYDDTDGSLTSSVNSSRWGAAVGTGLEFGFTPNVSAGIDYVHGFLGAKTYAFPGIDEPERIRQGLDMVTLRLNYKFSPSTVVAKY